MNRVLNPSKYLNGIVDEGRTFYIGFGIKNLTDLGKALPDLGKLINGAITIFVVTGKKGALKENTNGKFIRAQPERKESIWKHIHYYSKRFEKEIDYDREFHIWEKVILHKYNLALEAAKTPQGEIVLHFPAFKMSDKEKIYLRAGAAMNMSIALGSYFMIYDNSFEPIVPVTKFEPKRILSSGSATIEEKLEVVERELTIGPKNEKSEGNSYRFAMLKEMSPTDVTMGIGGFDEYLMFEYIHDDLMILENLKTGNATFLFRLSTFDKTKELNKQTANFEPSFLKRIVHNNLDDWNKKFSAYFKR